MVHTAHWVKICYRTVPLFTFEPQKSIDRSENILPPNKQGLIKPALVSGGGVLMGMIFYWERAMKHEKLRLCHWTHGKWQLVEWRRFLFGFFTSDDVKKGSGSSRCGRGAPLCERKRRFNRKSALSRFLEVADFSVRFSFNETYFFGFFSAECLHLLFFLILKHQFRRLTCVTGSSNLGLTITTFQGSKWR